MIQIQPKYTEKEKWLDYAKKRTLRYEIIEFSFAYLNSEIDNEQYEWYRNSGLSDSVHGVFIDNYPLSFNDDIRKLSREHCEKSCRQAKMIGAENIVFHSTALPFVRAGQERLWGRDAAEYYSFLAEKYDLNVYIENFNDIDYDPLLFMMQNVQSEKVRICLDIGHANYTRYSVGKWFEKLADHIGYIHISDNNGMFDDHKILGTGNVDFLSADDFYAKKNGNIPLTIEVSSLNGLDESILFLEKNHLFGF
ncbi:MAG: sugar phosphate isomerase/epimerase [Lachnospiraceae bacterium]|nr:sugar phosphate isomerase/epimerase [Lachnospiraceae bacterium]